MFVLFEFSAGETLAVDGAPSVEDVGQDKGDDEGNNAHSREGELARATVGQGERTLRVGQ